MNNRIWFFICGGNLNWKGRDWNLWMLGYDLGQKISENHFSIFIIQVIWTDPRELRLGGMFNNDLLLNQAVWFLNNRSISGRSGASLKLILHTTPPTRIYLLQWSPQTQKVVIPSPVPESTWLTMWSPGTLGRHIMQR